MTERTAALPMAVLRLTVRIILLEGADIFEFWIPSARIQPLSVGIKCP